MLIVCGKKRATLTNDQPLTTSLELMKIHFSCVVGVCEKGMKRL